MRCMTLAIAFTAFGWIALDTITSADETPAIDFSYSTSSRPSYIGLTADRQVAEIASPTDIATSQSPTVTPGNAPMPSSAVQGHDLATVHGYRPPLPFGPSSPPSLLQFMACDPHSCPNIWQGYEAQRAAELAKKCTPPGCGSCGAGCGRSQLYNSPCITCASRPMTAMNRYRAAPKPACNSCGNVGCDGLSPGSAGSNGCSSCQAATKPVESERLSGLPTPATTR